MHTLDINCEKLIEKCAFSIFDEVRVSWSEMLSEALALFIFRTKLFWFEKSIMCAIIFQ